MNAYYESCELLSQGKIYQAINRQKNWIDKLHDDGINERCKQILQTYNYLISYFLEGKDDPSRWEVRNQLIRQTYSLIDDIYESMRISTNSSKEFEYLRSNTIPFETNFYKIWLSQTWTDADRNEFNNILLADDEIQKCLAISALTLNILRHFSVERLSALIDSIDYLQNSPRERAIIGVIIILLKYNERVKYYIDINEQITKLVQSEKYREHITNIIYQLILTKKTLFAEKAIEEMQQKVMQDMPKTNQEEQLKVVILDESEDNPKWLEKTQHHISKQMNQLAQLNQEGVDINYGHLKTSYSNSFFNSNIENWFTPYYQENPQLEYDFTTTIGKLLSDILRVNEMCDSDKYALCFFYKQVQSLSNNISEEQWKMVGQQFDMQDFAVTVTEDKLAIDYIRNLYRFYNLNLFKYNNEWDTFINKIPYSLLYNLCNTSSNLQLKIVDVFIEVERFSIAKDILNELIKVQPTLENYQKLGFCYEKTNYPLEAIKYYSCAELLAENDKWTMLHLSYCYEAVNQYDMAIKTLDSLITIYGQKRSYLLRKAEIFATMKSSDNFKKTLYQIEMLYPDFAPVHRQLLIVKEQYQEAIALYENANVFEMDIDKLHLLGVNTETISILFDAISQRA